MVKLERTKNSVRNMIWGILNKIVSLLLPFLIRIVIINVLGKEYLGLNNLFTSILNVLNLAELGVGSAMVYSMYKPIAMGEKDQICSLLSLYKKFYNIIGLVILGVGLLLIPFLPYLIKDEPASINIPALYIIFLIDTALSYLLFAYKSSLLTAHQRTDVISNIGTCIHLILNILQIIILIIFKNYYLYIILKPIFTIINNICFEVITNRMYPDYKATGNINNPFKSEIFSRVIALIGHKIGQTVVSSADSLVISAFLGLGVLAVYSNYYYIIFFVVSITSIIFNGMLAGIGNSLIVETKEHNYRLFLNINFVSCWMISWCTTSLFCLLQPFMFLWMGEDMLLSNSSLLCIVIYFYTWQFRTTGLFFKDAAGMWKDDFCKPYVAAIINLIANILLVKVIGINGVFISTIICMVGINFPWETYVLFKKLFKTSPISYIVKQVLYSILTLIACIVSYYLCDAITKSNYNIISLLTRLVICLIVPNCLFLLFFHRTKEFEFVKQKITQLLLKIRGN